MQTYILRENLILAIAEAIMSCEDRALESGRAGKSAFQAGLEKVLADLRQGASLEVRD